MTNSNAQLQCPMRFAAVRPFGHWGLVIGYVASPLMRHTLLILAIALCGCSDGGATGPSTVVEPDTRPAFVLDASKPFVIELGRGSGLHGLDVTKVSETGAVELHRIAGGQNVETATLRLSDVQVKELVDLINSQRLTSMGRSYTAPGVADGTQWVLWVRQAPSEKSIYFNNAFPNEITSFAGRLDALLQGAGSGTASWTPVPEQQGIDQQAALWARIQPAR